MSEEEKKQKKKPYDWSVWGESDPLDTIIDQWLSSSVEEEERKGRKDQELAEAMLLMKKLSIEDEERERMRKVEDMKFLWQQDEYERRRKQEEEEIARRRQQLERPKVAVRNFWDYMNSGIHGLANSPPNYADAIAQFHAASALMAGEIQFLIPETEDYRMMMRDVRSLAETYAYICRALMEFNAGGDFRTTMNYALTELERARNTIPGMYVSLRSMCEAFIDDAKREVLFNISVQSLPTDLDSGAIILLLMALTLNRREKKYDGLIDELYRRMHIS